MVSFENIRKRSKSNKLSNAEWKALKVLLKDVYAMDLAIEMGISRQTLYTVRRVGSGSFETIQKIREVLNQSK